MTLSDIGEILTGIAAMIAAVFSAIAHGKIRELHVIINSRLTALLKLTAKNARAKGVKEERERNDDE